MKKILYILLAIIMAACTHEDIATIQGTDGTPVTLTFKVQVPEMGVASRTFGDNDFLFCIIVPHIHIRYFVATAQQHVYDKNQQIFHSKAILYYQVL